MLVRLLILGVIIALIYIGAVLHFLTFLIAFFGYYVAFLVLEILYVQGMLRRDEGN